LSGKKLSKGDFEMDKSKAQDVIAEMVDAGTGGAIMFNGDPEVRMWVNTAGIGNIRFGNPTNFAIVGFDVAVQIVQGIGWIAPFFSEEN